MGGRLTRIVSAMCLMLALPAAPRVQGAEALIGTWRLVRYELWLPGGVQEPLGANPTGYVVFDPTGRAFVQITRDSAAGDIL